MGTLNGRDIHRKLRACWRSTGFMTVVHCVTLNWRRFHDASGRISVVAHLQFYLVFQDLLGDAAMIVTG